MYEQDFQKISNECIDILNDNHVGVLATSSNNYATSRTMFYLNLGLDLYLLTHQNYFKNEQIKQNNNVSYSVNNISIDGKLSKSELDEQHQKLYDRLLKTNYLRFSEGDDLVLYKLEPEVIKIWNQPNGVIKRTFLYPRLKLVSEKLTEK